LGFACFDVLSRYNFSMYLPGYPPRPFPLARFLPPLAEGVAASYAERFTAPNDIVIDPFGQSPRVALELARLGRKVIVTTNNPILRLALGAVFNPVPATTLQLVLTRLADIRMNADRVETYVRAYYRSTCPDCNSPVEVDAYEWERETLTEKSYYCETCGAERTHAVDEADLELVNRLSARGPQYHWALEQVAPGADPDRDLYAEALELYTPRALSVLFTLTLKITSLELDEAERRALDTLLLMAYDEALSFPAAGQRPRTLKPHARFRERNIWLALERLARDGGWQSDGGPEVLLTTLTQISTEPGVVIHEGSIRDLAKTLRAKSVPCLMGALPRPNLVFWTLSTIWTAWLWGQAAAAPLGQLIQRRRYDWAWHENALRSSFSAAQELLNHSGRFIALLPEAEPGFLAATLMAADGTQYTLVEHGLRADPPEAQLVFQPDAVTLTPSDDLSALIRTQADEAAQSVLRQRGEPSRWQSLSGAIYVSLAHTHLLRQAVESISDDPLNAVDDWIEAACVKSVHLVDLRNTETETESGRATAGVWWLVDPAGADSPLADRTEHCVAQALGHVPPSGLDFVALEEQVCESLPGLTLPGAALIQRCLESYGEEDEGLWHFRPEDRPDDRAKEFEQMLQDLLALGTRLGYTPTLPLSDQVLWPSPSPELSTYHFYVTQMAEVGGTLLAPGGFVLPPSTHRFIVIPGGRSALIDYKVKRDPRLKLAIAQGGWLFIKYRHIRRLLAGPALTPTELLTILDRDPVTEQHSAQLPLW
jgi:hypothetical protein